MQEGTKKVLKVAIAAVAVVGGSFLGATIGVPALSLAQADGETATANPVADTVDDAVDPVTDATGGATAPLPGRVEQAPAPAPGTSDGGQVAPAQEPAEGDERRPPGGPGHMCSGEAPSEADAERVRAAVAEEVEGATVERIHTDCANGAAYAAHIVRSDGTRAIAFLSEDFEVTEVKDCGPGGRGRGMGGPGRPAPQADGATAEDANA